MSCELVIRKSIPFLLDEVATDSHALSGLLSLFVAYFGMRSQMYLQSLLFPLYQASFKSYMSEG